MRKVNEKEIKELTESVDLNYVESLLQNNEFEFEYKNTKYKVRKPTYKEKQEAYEKKISKYNELLEKTDEKGNFIYKTESELIELYKKRGIDIEELNKKFVALEQQRKKYQEKLGKAIKDKKPDNELEVYKREIENIEEQQKEITAKKTLLLDGSIESQANIFFYNYLSYLITEKMKNNKWIKAFNAYEDFLNSDEELVNQCVFYTTLIVLPEF